MASSDAESQPTPPPPRVPAPETVPKLPQSIFSLEKRTARGRQVRTDDAVEASVAIAGYPNVNTYASAPGSRNVTWSVRSRTVSCWRTS